MTVGTTAAMGQLLIVHWLYVFCVYLHNGTLFGMNASRYAMEHMGCCCISMCVGFFRTYVLLVFFAYICFVYGGGHSLWEHS